MSHHHKHSCRAARTKEGGPLVGKFNKRAENAGDNRVVLTGDQHASGRGLDDVTLADDNDPANHQRLLQALDSLVLHSLYLGCFGLFQHLVYLWHLTHTTSYHIEVLSQPLVCTNQLLRQQTATASVNILIDSKRCSEYSEEVAANTCSEGGSAPPEQTKQVP